MTMTEERPTTTGAERDGEVGFTGTKRGMTRVQALGVQAALARTGGRTLHHGDCIGADEDAHAIATALGYGTHGHPSTLEKARAFCVCDVTEEPLEPLTRNRAIVASVGLLIAAPRGMTEERRSGTWATVRYARAAQIPVRIIYPDGSESP